MDEKILKELQEIKAILNTNQGKDPNELLTAEQLSEETGIGINMVRDLFKDQKLAVQRYTRPFLVKRQVWNDYISENHDYLIER